MALRTRNIQEETNGIGSYWYFIRKLGNVAQTFLVAVDCSAVVWIRTVHEAGYVTSVMDISEFHAKNVTSMTEIDFKISYCVVFILQCPSIQSFPL